MSDERRAWFVLIREPLLAHADGSLLIDETVDEEYVVEVREDVAGDTKRLRDILAHLNRAYGKERPR
jgi:hypothetical protein